MRHRKRSDNSEDLEKCLAEPPYSLPFSAAVIEDRRQQQGTQKE
jgi:hypothetical protein